MKRTTINKKNNERPTWYIKYLAESAIFELCTLNKHSNDLKGKYSKMPNISYTYPLCGILKELYAQTAHLVFADTKARP